MYEALREIMERLTKRNPDNAQWQYDLAYSYRSLGEVDLARKQYAQAAAGFAARHAILVNLMARDPSNANWQWELATSYDALGRLAESQGNCTRRSLPTGPGAISWIV